MSVFGNISGRNAVKAFPYPNTVNWDQAMDCEISQDAIVVTLGDGRTVSVPLEWFPRLVHATQAERNNWALIGNDEGIHWPEVDEDISISSLLKGLPSQECSESLQCWIDSRA